MCDSAITIYPDTLPSIVIEDNEPGSAANNSMIDSATRPDTAPSIEIEDGHNELESSSNNQILFQDEIEHKPGRQILFQDEIEHEPGSQLNPIVIVEENGELGSSINPIMIES